MEKHCHVELLNAWELPVGICESLFKYTLKKLRDIISNLLSGFAGLRFASSRLTDRPIVSVSIAYIQSVPKKFFIQGSATHLQQKHKYPFIHQKCY